MQVVSLSIDRHRCQPCGLLSYNKPSSLSCNDLGLPCTIRAAGIQGFGDAAAKKRGVVEIRDAFLRVFSGCILGSLVSGNYHMAQVFTAFLSATLPRPLAP